MTMMNACLALHALAVVLVIIVGFSPMDRFSERTRWLLFAFLIITMMAGAPFYHAP